VSTTANATWAPPPPTPPASRSDAVGKIALLVLLGGFLTALATVIGNGNVVAALLPILGAVALWLVWVNPLRNTLFVLMFLGLAIDRPGDAEGTWDSPFSFIGGLLFQSLTHVVPLEFVRFPGIAAAAALLLAIRAHRVLIGRTKDTPDSLVPSPPAMWAIGMSTATVMIWVAYGALVGGDVQRAKLQVQIFLVLNAVAYLFATSLRGTRDYGMLARVVVAAAISKALLAIWVRTTGGVTVDPVRGLRPIEYASNHGDSMLFTCAAIILIAPFFFRPTKRHIRWFLLAMPIIVAGVIANDRRVAWAEIGVGVVLLFIMNLRAPLTRSVVRAFVWTSPILALYATLGWMSSNPIFSPVHTIRSMITAERTDGTIDRSTLFRDVENYNLVATFRQNPLLGAGLGIPFTEAAKNDDLSAFKEYQFLPHNAMLGLWAFTGGLGFFGLFTQLVVVLFLGIRSRLYAVGTRLSDYGMGASVAVATLMAYALHMWADIGFTEPPSVFLVSTAIAVAAQAATATGAWPARSATTGGSWQP